MDKNGVIGIVSRASQPINKQSEAPLITTNVNTYQNPPSYYFQKFQRNAQKVLQSDTDIDLTPSTRSDYPSYKFRHDFQKLNMDEYEIVAIPKKALEGEKYSMTHSFVPLMNKGMGYMPNSNVAQSQQLMKTHSNNSYSRQLKNANPIQNANPFIQAGYGALKQKQLYLQNLKK
ncbi:unnamed protein product (macronuclear) [Paramecium tetraurelia]|uniref:Uncharacterized protein n=1 Tax=Paramecium tetraurelia TaxID=5888 RepID=A0BH12_PARTE|nr:uncharacterized protein GSPATT00028864001 [Paramecium tetraurelia]CAK57829.1 unnamed protein product [Paramecium tetraurelia]|eukprot:XP_001425227.1 hypothetical protein (macronuclear) [Paramecium tetraurelia strain d4-2]